MAFQRLWSLWVGKRNISEGLRLRLYNAFIVPILTYNMGTRGGGGLTPTEWARFDSFHRRQLRQVIYIRYPEKISSNTLYERCECGPMSVSAIKARWGSVWSCDANGTLYTGTDGHRRVHHTHSYSWLAGAATYDTTNHPRQRSAGSRETAPQQARLATFKNICIRPKSMAYP